MKSKQEMLLLPLQFFADGAEEETTKEPETSSEESPKTFSQSDLDAAISRAVEAHSKKKEKEFQKLLDKAKEDGVVKGKTYAELTEEQKKAHDLEEREKALNDKEREIKTRERLSGIRTDLSAAGLPEILSQTLVFEEDDEKVKTYIADLKKALDAAVNDKVKESLRQDPPKSDGAKGGKTKSLAEQIAEERNNKKSSVDYDPWKTN